MENRPDAIEGQLSDQEREFIVNSILQAPVKPRITLEVGTWYGGGSTLHILRALEQNGEGHLYGIEADRSIYDRMISNLQKAAPEASKRFTPIFGMSRDAIPQWLATLPQGTQVDFAFLDGGNNPMEQIQEFKLLDNRMPVGAQLLSHDAKMRKGKFLVPYMSSLDHWQVELCEFSQLGMLYAKKVRPQPSPESLKAAKSKLFQLRLQPKEMLSAILPRQLCNFILSRVPSKWAKAIADTP